MNHSHEQIPRPWYQRIGPGLITACVVIGPGSILTSSKIGSTQGYSLSWVVVLSVLFMLAFTAMAARIGVVSQRSMADIVTEKVGRWLSFLIGFSVFFIASAFQFGNNLGVHSAFEQFVDVQRVLTTFEIAGSEQTLTTGQAILIGFNLLSMMFLFAAKHLYVIVERLMMTFVALMLISFAINLGFAKPSFSELAQGFVPQKTTVMSLIRGEDLTVIGLIGTTFVVAAAYYQSYLARQKGWNLDQLQDGMIDARIGAALMGLITLTIMTTSAAVLRGKELTSVGDVARQLEPLFGVQGKLLFCVGLFSAAYSSFIVNSMIGGFIFADGCGLGSRPEDRFPRIMTAVTLLTGMGVAMWVTKMGMAPVPAIVAAQAITVLASPLMAGTILWISNSKDVMGEHTTGWLGNLIGGIGFVLLLGMAANTALNKVWPQVSQWLK